MSSEQATRVFFDLQPATPESWGADLGNRVYLPISPVAIDTHKATGWSLYELAEMAFEIIPDDAEKERKVAGEILTRLEDFARPIILTALGPDEGDYYAVLTNREVRGAEENHGKA